MGPEFNRVDRGRVALQFAGHSDVLARAGHDLVSPAWQVTTDTPNSSEDEQRQVREMRDSV